MEIFLQKNFKKKFGKLPLQIKIKFWQKVDIFINNPFDSVLNNHSVHKAFKDCRSINITGDYRAIYKYDNEVAVFINIGTHAQLYG